MYSLDLTSRSWPQSFHFLRIAYNTLTAKLTAYWPSVSSLTEQSIALHIWNVKIIDDIVLNIYTAILYLIYSGIQVSFKVSRLDVSIMQETLWCAMVMPPMANGSIAAVPADGNAVRIRHPRLSTSAPEEILHVYQERGSLRGLTRTFILELDALWSFVLKKANDSWIWIALCRRTRQVIAYAVGNWSLPDVPADVAGHSDGVSPGPLFYGLFESLCFARGLFASLSSSLQYRAGYPAQVSHYHQLRRRPCAITVGGMQLEVNGSIRGKNQWGRQCFQKVILENRHSSSVRCFSLLPGGRRCAYKYWCNDLQCVRDCARSRASRSYAA